LLRAFFPREKPEDMVYRIPVLLFALALAFCVGLVVIGGFRPTIRTAPAGVSVFAGLIVSAAYVMPLVKRCLQYRTVEVGDDARLVLSIRSPFQNTRQTWEVEDVREVIVYTGYPRRVSVRLPKLKVELAGFRKRGDAEAFADMLSQALGFAVHATRR
jgi:hypothetical protein